jgi:hypothetical protein
VITDAPLVGTDPTTRARRLVLLVDGLFLAVVGALQVSFELAGYFAGAGPLGAVFHDSPYTIGWVENHGFALLVGVLFVTVAGTDGRRFWHRFALAVHVLLGAANVTFWSSFVFFALVPMGVAATAAHVLFVGAHVLCLLAARRAVAT